jgi:hypothetical protein
MFFLKNPQFSPCCKKKVVQFKNDSSPERHTEIAYILMLSKCARILIWFLASGCRKGRINCRGTGDGWEVGPHLEVSWNVMGVPPNHPQGSHDLVLKLMGFGDPPC